MANLPREMLSSISVARDGSIVIGDSCRFSRTEATELLMDFDKAELINALFDCHQQARSGARMLRTARAALRAIAKLEQPDDNGRAPEGFVYDRSNGRGDELVKITRRQDQVAPEGVRVRSLRNAIASVA